MKEHAWFWNDTESPRNSLKSLLSAFSLGFYIINFFNIKNFYTSSCLKTVKPRFNMPTSWTYTYLLSCEWQRPRQRHNSDLPYPVICRRRGGSSRWIPSRSALHLWGPLQSTTPHFGHSPIASQMSFIWKAELNGTCLMNKIYIKLCCKDSYLP